ncbi:hypothetical protein M3Y98_00824600 [Aphelenchoides besseyi]|nr:hypothetical protein M3Y98_00824600 [Aphelenchoides besseyi]
MCAAPYPQVPSIQPKRSLGNLAQPKRSIPFATTPTPAAYPFPYQAPLQTYDRRKSLVLNPISKFSVAEQQHQQFLKQWQRRHGRTLDYDDRNYDDEYEYSDDYEETTNLRFWPGTTHAGFLASLPIRSATIAGPGNAAVAAAAVVAATATASRGVGSTTAGGFVGLGNLVGATAGMHTKRDSMAAIADLLVATSGGRTRPHYGKRTS